MTEFDTQIIPTARAMSFLFSGRVQLSKCAKNFTLPHLWLDATYVRCRRDGRVASTAVVTAIGCDEGGWRRVLGLSVVDTESYDSWLGFLRRIKGRGVQGVQLVTSDAHKGLVGAIEEAFRGASWQRCAVHLMRDCMREAGSRQLKKRVGRIMSPAFRAKDAATARAMYHVACDMLRECCPKAADVAEGAEPDALAYLAFPPAHWKRLRTNNVQERANREIKRRSRVGQVFPSERSLERLVGAVMCERTSSGPLRGTSPTTRCRSCTTRGGGRSPKRPAGPPPTSPRRPGR